RRDAAPLFFWQVRFWPLADICDRSFHQWSRSTTCRNEGPSWRCPPQCDTRLGMLSPLIQLCVLVLLCLTVPETGQAETCRNTSFEGETYISCSFNPAKQNLRLFWRGADGKPYQTFGTLARDLETKGKSLQFAMNGGMYQDDFQPVGLYVENGRELMRANIATLNGAPSSIPNFFKKPNGVFYIGNGAAGILETGRF